MESLENRLSDGFGFREDLSIPEPQHAVAVCPKIGVAICIVSRVGQMLATVQFHDEAGFETDKVTNVFSHGSLATKFEAVEPTSTKMTPEKSLGVGGVIAQIASVVVHIDIERAVCGENEM
jgi:hypothetical protein